MTLTDTRKALQDILEEATATDYAVCYVTDADEETLRSAIQAIDDMKKMQGIHWKIRICEYRIARS